MQLSSKARKAVAAGLAASTVVWAAGIGVLPQIASAATHSDGCLVLSGGIVWLIQDNTRRGFTSAEVFASHGYNFSQVATATSEDLDLPVGPIMTYADGTLVKGPNDPLVYLVTDGQKRGFTTGSVFTGLGFSFANIQQAPANTFADLPTGSNLDNATERHGAGVLVNASGTLWLMTTSGREAFPSMDVFNSYGYMLSHVVAANAADLATSDEGVVSARPGCSTSDNGSSSGDLNGGAGDLSLTSTSTNVENSVKEGEQENILGVKAEADGSDIQITSLKLTFANQDNSSSNRLDRYVDTVSVYLGDDKVGSADAADFSRDGDNYSKTISLNNAIVRDGSSNKQTLYVAVEANDSINDTDLNNASWGIEINTLRFIDATGAILTGDVSSFDDVSDNDQFTFEDASADDTMSVTASTSNPQATAFQVNEDSTSDNYLIHAFKLKTGSDAGDVQVDGLKVALTVNDPANTASSDDESAIFDDVTLKVGSTTYSADNISTGGITDGDGTATYTFDFDDGDFVVDGDSSTEVKVYAKFNDQDGNYGSGTTVSSNVSGSDIDAESVSNGDDVNVTGSSTSKTHSLSVNAPTFDLSDVDLNTFTAIDGVATGEEDIYLAQFKFDVTAGDDDIYLNKNVLVNDSTFPTAAISYTVTGGATVSSVVLDPSDSSLDDNSTDYLITAGSTEEFTLSFYLTGNNAANQVTIDGFSYGLNDQDRDLSVTSGLSDFHTNTVYLAK